MSIKINKSIRTVPILSEMTSVIEIEDIVERIVNRKLQALLSDPDYSLKLRKEFEQKLDCILKKKKKTISEEEIAMKYEIEL